MTTFRVAGVDDPRPEPSVLGTGLPPGAAEVKQSVLVEVSRAGGPRRTLEHVQPSDVLEFEFQDGLRLWMRADDVPRDLGRTASRDAGTGVIELPSELQIGPASRAGTGWAIKALKVVGLDIAGEIADFVAAHVEGKLRPGPGLYRCTADRADALTPVRRLGGRKPVLLFLHGTASSTDGSFGDLWHDTGDNAIIRTLLTHYDGRVLALQHRTLTQSPIENAAFVAEALANLLDPEAELHIVSHSRGGLVGELLARSLRVGAAPISRDELELFRREERAADVKALQALNRALQDARVQVTRFVRVACPARGTALADRRLDRYLSVLVNLASFIPGLRGNPVYEGLTSLLAGVLAKRTDPNELPGLEAMMPTSPLVRILNRPDARTRADLHVLGGDLAPSGIWGRLKALATDLYYRDDHDLVVNTPSMLGGTARTEPVKYWIDTGGQVTHFHYFSRPDTSRRLVAALTGSSADFRTLTPRSPVVTSSDYVKRAADRQPVVFVLPGIMGSQLSAGGDAIWMNLLRLATGGLAAIKMGVGRVTATGLLRDGYADLCKYLSASHTVVEFPYDWRQPLSETAEKLRAAIDEVLPTAEAAGQPVRLLAHSMGGLVVRAMLATPAGQRTWRRMCQHPGARFVMLGTPNGGSHAIPVMLIGRDALVKQLALLDLRNDYRGLLDVIAAFEGVLDLLPHKGGALDFYDPAEWERLLEADAPAARGLFGGSIESSVSAGFRWVIPPRESLKRAKALAATIAASPLDPARTVYVAGVADETPCELVIDEAEQDPRRRVKVRATSEGDGRVLWSTGIPSGIRTFYMDTVHGDMASDARHFPALLDLLTSGHTSKLASRPPARRAGAEVFEMREVLPDMVPDEAELVAAALGGRRARARRDEPATTVHVRLVHDNLTNARYPVLVGHYQDDVIVGAERYLDDRLHGRLSELLHMDLYPGPTGTAVVVMNDQTPGTQSLHPGAVIAGLGRVGELAPGRLTATLAQAMTMYGSERAGAERRRRQREGVPIGAEGLVSAPLTAILVGSGEGGLSLGDCVQALVRAVAIANKRLRQPANRTEEGGSSPVGPVAQIDHLDIVELYEDRAIEAVHALRGLARSAEFDGFIFEDQLVIGKEGQRRASYASDLAWWQRLRVTSSDGAMKFEALTQTARAPAELRPTQRRLVEGFVEQAIQTTGANRELGYTLFELLVPTDFKPYAPERRKLAIVMDPESAALPWELLHDRFDLSAEPLSVASGLIRQLLVPSSREQMLRRPDRNAFVLGNPYVSDPKFGPLQGAEEEAMAVADLLGSGGYDVTLLTGRAAHPMAVFSELHRNSWRILHLAAHGIYEPSGANSDAPTAGLVLDNGLLLTPAEAEQLRYVPELVFINCCHLGRMSGETPRPPFHRLAANLATQFIRMGVRAVIAAGWAVDDLAARTFGTAFYRAMLDGAQFGDAVLFARKETYAKHAETNTWGAYQCYGDPSFSLKTGTSAVHVPVPAAERELVLLIEGIARSARERNAQVDMLCRHLDESLASCPQGWSSAELHAAAGAAYAQLGRYERALEYLEKVPVAAHAMAPIRALEQLANCRVRVAGQKIDAEVPDLEGAIKLLDSAEDLLNHLLGIGRTPERCSLLAGVWKRRAMLPRRTSVQRRDALRRMSELYGEAVRLWKDDNDRGYPLVNQIAADVVRSWRGPGAAELRRKIARDIAALRDLGAELAKTRTDAFSLAIEAERMLLSALAERRLEARRAADIEQKYKDAISRGIAPRHLDSMRSQFAFFRRMAHVEAPPERRDALVKALERLERL